MIHVIKIDMKNDFSYPLMLNWVTTTTVKLTTVNVFKIFFPQCYTECHLFQTVFLNSMYIIIINNNDNNCLDNNKLFIF